LRPGDRRAAELLEPERWDTFRGMGNDCHRCGSQLASPEMFCPNCGAPQLLYDAGAEADNGSSDPGSPALRNVQWKAAVGAAITFAVPVGVLCSPVVPILSVGCCLWVVGGAVAAVGLYQRRAATSILPRPVGIRIGAIIGIMAAAVASAFNAGALVFLRYVLHGGDAMDKAYQATTEQAWAATAPLSAALARFAGGSSADSHDTLRFMLSPDGRAASAIMTALMTSVGITLFSMIGGALGTRIFSGRDTAPRNP
jgi:hypothetical protein